MIVTVEEILCGQSTARCIKEVKEGTHCIGSTGSGHDTTKRESKAWDPAWGVVLQQKQTKEEAKCTCITLIVLNTFQFACFGERSASQGQQT